MRDLEARGERLRRPVHQPVERPAIPVDVALRRRLLHHHLLARPPAWPRGAGSRRRARGACATTQPRSSKPLRPARPAICWKSRTPRMPVFSPSNLQSCVKSTVRMRDVDADAQRVGAAHDLEQPLLRQPLDEQAVLRQAGPRGECRSRGAGSAGTPCRRACRSWRRPSRRAAPPCRSSTRRRRSSGSAPPRRRPAA